MCSLDCNNIEKSLLIDKTAFTFVNIINTVTKKTKHRNIAFFIHVTLIREHSAVLLIKAIRIRRLLISMHSKCITQYYYKTLTEFAVSLRSPTYRRGAARCGTAAAWLPPSQTRGCGANSTLEQPSRRRSFKY